MLENDKIDVGKMNDCILESVKSKEKTDLFDKYFEQIVKFQDGHSKIVFDEKIADESIGNLTPTTKVEIINLLLTGLFDKIKKEAK